jgi:hypothetical protein
MLKTDNIINIFLYTYTFALAESDDSSVMRQRLQDCMNSTGVLFTYI